MRMMNELKHLYLYSANKKVYVPIDENDRRKNSAILLLSPSFDISLRMMKLPYVYNPNLFTSLFIDRNVMAYIDSVDQETIDFDEQEETAVSEAMVKGWTNKVKFKFDDTTSIMDKKYIDRICQPKVAATIARTLDLRKVPEEIEIIVHPNVSNLREEAPNVSKSDNTVFSFTSGNKMHLVSKLVYDQEYMGGPYDIYVKTELIYCMIKLYNDSIPSVIARGISSAISGQEKWIRDTDNNVNRKDLIAKFAYTTRQMIEKEGMRDIIRYIRTGNIDIFSKYISRHTLGVVSKFLFEGNLSYFDRQRLLPSEFGIPEKRKYPMPDEEHVRLAIKMFNNCDPDDEKELAQAIKKKMKKFGLTTKDIKVSAVNRFRKYITESAIYEAASFENSDYADIMKICDTLSKEELSRITFYDTYRDSPFVIKRIIHREDGNPTGFLDVYQFPSKPEIAQIVIAVNGNYRGMGIANKMVEELLSSHLENTHNFNIYYWTAHPNNDASINLALNHGFKDTNQIDRYGRRVFINMISKPASIWEDIPDYLKPMIGYEDFTSSNEAFVTESSAIFFEADNTDKYSARLRRYLYSERMKNNKAVLELYEKAKQDNPHIRKTYLRIKMYKKLNTFVDLSYYHGLFLQKNTMKLDKAVTFYFDFLNRLINNKEIDSEYNKKTIFIPIDIDAWPVQPSSELYDFRKNLNPISIIFRLVRTNLAALRKAWGNQDIVFVGNRGYFKIDFNKLEIKDLARIKINLRKLRSDNEVIEDEFETDDIKPDTYETTDSNTDTPKARAIKMIDKIEKATDVRIDDVSPIKKIGTPSTSLANLPHLRIRKEPIKINDRNGVLVISVDPDGPNGFDSNSIFSKINLDTYCMPEG